MTQPAPAGIWVVTDECEDRINNGFFVVSMSGFNPRPLVRQGHNPPRTAGSPNNRDVLWLAERSTGSVR